MLRTLIIVTFFGLGLLWWTVIGWIVWRLGPGGYDANDAQQDRERICALIETLHPHHGYLCPRILEAD